MTGSPFPAGGERAAKLQEKEVYGVHTIYRIRISGRFTVIPISFCPGWVVACWNLFRQGHLSNRHAQTHAKPTNGTSVCNNAWGPESCDCGWELNCCRCPWMSEFNTCSILHIFIYSLCLYTKSYKDIYNWEIDCCFGSVWPGFWCGRQVPPHKIIMLVVHRFTKKNFLPANERVHTRLTHLAKIHFTVSRLDSCYFLLNLCLDPAGVRLWCQHLPG